MSFKRLVEIDIHPGKLSQENQIRVVNKILNKAGKTTDSGKYDNKKQL